MVATALGAPWRLECCDVTAFGLTPLSHLSPLALVALQPDVAHSTCLSPTHVVAAVAASAAVNGLSPLAATAAPALGAAWAHTHFGAAWVWDAIELCAALVAACALGASHLSCVCAVRAVAASPLAAVRARLGSSRHAARSAAAPGLRAAPLRAYAPAATPLATLSTPRAYPNAASSATISAHADSNPLAAPHRDTRNTVPNLVARSVPHVRPRPHATLDRCSPRTWCAPNDATLRSLRLSSSFSFLVGFRLLSPR